MDTKTALMATFGFLAASVPFLPAAAAQPAILPAGDSITAGDSYGGYRGYLKASLDAANIPFVYVGDQQDVAGAHAGHSGWQIGAVNSAVSGWLKTFQPQVMLLHIGTNNMGSGGLLAAGQLTTLLTTILRNAPALHIVLAQILPMSHFVPGDSADPAVVDAAVKAYNGAIPALVEAQRAKGQNIRIVDMYDAVPLSDLIDGIHPSAAGYQKMADVWYPAVAAALAEPFDGGVLNEPGIDAAGPDAHAADARTIDAALAGTDAAAAAPPPPSASSSKAGCQYGSRGAAGWGGLFAAALATAWARRQLH